MNTVKERNSIEELTGRKNPKKLPQYVAVLTGTIATLAVGTTFSWSSPASQPLRDGSYLNGYKVSLEEESWVGGLMPLGAAAMTFPAAYFTDKLGRKMTMLLQVLPFTLGWAFVLWPQGVYMLFAGRFLHGMTTGAFSVTMSIYTAEIAEDDVRGALGSYFKVLLVSGIVLVYLLATFCSLWALSLVCSIIPFVFLIVFIFMPESPLFYVSKNQDDKARDALHFLRGKNFDIEPELDGIRSRVLTSAAVQGSVWQDMTTTAVKQGILVMVVLMFFQQLGGVNAVIFNASSIFQSANVSLDANIAALIIGVVELIGTVASVLVVDRWGRRILLLFSASLMMISMTLLGLYFYLKETEFDVSVIDWLPMLSLSVFLFSYTAGFGALPWMMMGELFHPQVKGLAAAFSAFVSWVLAFLVTKFYPSLLLAIGAPATYWIFAGMSTLGIISVYFFVIETKGKSMQQIQDELAGEKKPIEFVNSKF